MSQNSIDTLCHFEITSWTRLLKLGMIIGLAAGTQVGCASAPTPPPEPTEIADRGAHEERSRQRREWIEHLHRAAPGTDWRAVERVNWHRHLEARNRLTSSLGRGAPSPWSEVGSVNQAGRMHQASYDATGDTLYVGSSLGGVWRGHFDADAPNPAAMAWQPMGDNVYGTSVQTLRLNGPPAVLLKSAAGAWGGELHRSADGGATWTVSQGLEGRPRRLLRLDDAQETIFAIADQPNHWVSTPGTTRLYRSQDRGTSFQLVRDLGSYRGDLWTPRTGLGPLYLLVDNRLERSLDLGATWSVLGSLGWTGDSRVALTGSEAGAPSFYAVVEHLDGSGGRRLFHSSDGGATWTQRVEITDFWGDFTSLAASTTDPDLVLYGGVDAFRSTDGGAGFERINFWHEYYGSPADKLHADITQIDFVPLSGGGEILFISTDGGIYYSDDGGLNVSNLSLEGLRVSQYYSTLTDSSDENNILAGAQDQGYQDGSAADGLFDQLISGDYGSLTSSDGTHGLVYSTYPGFILISEDMGDTVVLHDADFPANETYHWLPVVVADPDDGSSFYFCAKHIYKYTRSGNDWLPTQLPFNFEVDANEFVSSLIIAPSAGDRWYAGTDRGRFYYSTDAGMTWTLSTFDTVPAPQYLTGLAMHVDPANPSHVVIAGAGYSNPSVYRSTDGGAVFSALGQAMPSTIFYDLAGDPVGSGDLFAATESGPYKYEADLDTWTSILGTDAPMTTYWSVEALSDRVRFATYGRGVWDYRVLLDELFDDGFESGDTTLWSAVIP